MNIGLYPLSSGNPKDNLIWGRRESLSYVYIELTNRCNLHCAYCQIDANERFDMSLHTVKSIIDQLVELKVFELRLGGGEPLLYPYLEDVVQYASQKKLFVWICTNGYKFDSNFAVRLKQSGLTGIRVSLDSTSPVIHDRVRGQAGSWCHCMEAITIAQIYNINVVVSMTIGSHNIDEYTKMCELTNSHNCKLSTHFVMPKGKGEFFPKVDEKRNFDIIDKLSGEKHCVAATDTIYINVRGGVSACSFLDPIASVQEKTLFDIMQLPEMKRYALPIGGSNCSQCKYNRLEFCPISNICRGGCWVNYEKQSLAY